MKKSFLTPVLSGVLAVTVIGSGAAYYFEFVKDSDSGKESKKNGKTSITVDEAAANIEQSLDKAQKIAKGELDGGYKAEISYKAPAGSEEIGDISVTMEAKQKDKLSAMDYSVNYNSNAIISANIVYDNENEKAYVKVPELSDAYLTATVSELEEFMNSSLTSPYSTYDFDEEMYEDDLYEASAYTADAMAVTSAQPDFDAMADIDFEALLTDLEEYADIVSNNVPEPTDGENRTGSVDGASYDLTTKNYKITSSDGLKIAQAIADKGRTDETLKNALMTMGVTEDEYNTLWDEITDIDTTDTDTLDISVYYSGEDVAGFSLSDEDETAYVICASTDTQVIMDCDLAGEMTIKGAVGLDGDTLDGKITIDVNDEYDPVNMVITYDKLTVTDTDLIGNISYAMTSGGEETMNMTVAFNNSGDSFDITVSGNAEGQDIGSMNIKGQTTDASDITVPSGTMYNMTNESELETYLAGCDIEGWQASLKTSLGEELYNEIFGSSSGDINYDYDFDDDYDVFDDTTTAGKNEVNS